jgi:hypothetical protein
VTVASDATGRREGPATAWFDQAHYEGRTARDSGARRFFNALVILALTEQLY